jgi:hypothetical protein
MARQIKSLAQKVAGARIQAPSAPSAPAVRNWNGSMAASATASAYGAKKGVTDTGMGVAPGGSAKPGIDKGGPGHNPVPEVSGIKAQAGGSRH